MKKKKTRSELFYEKKRIEELKEKQMKSPTQRRSNRQRTAETSHTGKRHSKRRRKKRLRTQRLLAIAVSLFVIVIISVFAVKKLSMSDKEYVAKAMESVKNADIKSQQKYFDQMANISNTMSNSYANDNSKKEEFLKSAFSNLDYRIDKIEKTDKGITVTMEISNNDYMKIYRRTKRQNKNTGAFDKIYFENLRKDKNFKKNKCTLLIVKGVFSKKIYESAEFINACIGGAIDDKNN